MLVLGAMVCAALLAGLPTLWTAAGAVSFAVSDAMIGIGRFVLGSEALAVPIWWAYAVSQLLITAGLLFGRPPVPARPPAGPDGSRRHPDRQAAEHEPIARVLPLLTVPHLDREFDYLVAADQSDDAQPGVRVRVRFHGRLVDAFVLERRSETDHEGKLGWLEKVVSAYRC